jgi:hypothetical protein
MLGLVDDVDGHAGLPRRGGEGANLVEILDIADGQRRIGQIVGCLPALGRER